VQRHARAAANVQGAVWGLDVEKIYHPSIIVGGARHKPASQTAEPSRRMSELLEETAKAYRQLSPGSRRVRAIDVL
jgi:hypothetical protein